MMSHRGVVARFERKRVMVCGEPAPVVLSGGNSVRPDTPLADSRDARLGVALSMVSENRLRRVRRVGAWCGWKAGLWYGHTGRPILAEPFPAPRRLAQPD
jgi:hypothetical protein